MRGRVASALSKTMGRGSQPVKPERSSSTGLGPGPGPMRPRPSGPSMGSAASAKALQLESALRALDGRVIEQLASAHADTARSRSTSLDQHVRAPGHQHKTCLPTLHI